MINRYSAELDIGTLVDIGSGSIYQDWIGAIKNIAFNDLDAKYIYEVDLGNGYSTHCFASDLMPVTAMSKNEKLKKIKNGTHNDKRLLDKVAEVLTKYDPEDLWGTNRDPYEWEYYVGGIGGVLREKTIECEIGAIAYLMKTTEFNYITELADELFTYYPSYLSCSMDDCIKIARELMISIYNYEPPLNVMP